jgi:hypothetical protein
MWRVSVFILGLALSGLELGAQKIVYSEPERDDSRRLLFEIAGKVDGNFLIYKNNRGKSWISVLNNDMEQTASVELGFVPQNDRMINADFFSYGEHVYMIYQYQKKNIVYCMAAKIDGDGSLMGDLIQLDTTQIGFAASNRIYSVIGSEDKSRLMVFKINSKNKQKFLMTSMLMDDKLQLLRRSVIIIPMEERDDYLNDFHLDNEGDLVFTRFSRHNNDHISSAAFVIKRADSDSLIYNPLNIEKNWLDEIHVKVDNFNKRYLLTSFYFRERKGNIDGLYFFLWDKVNSRVYLEDTAMFSDELRRDARGDATAKMAFNDYFIRNIITRRDGGFLIGSEAYYTTSRFNNWNRWDYLYGAPYRSYNSNNYYYSPYYSSLWWNSRAGSSSQAVRYHADNIAVISFNAQGKLEWNNVMGKSQFDDETDDLLSYQLMNTGGQLHFLFNQQERRNNLLSDYSITPDGVMTRNPTLKNLDKGYEFMPKYGKQVSARQMIVPCIYRNQVCFAKIDYN